LFSRRDYVGPDTVTLSNVAVLRAELLAQTMSPPREVDEKLTDGPTCVQLLPFADLQAVTVVPVRVRRSHVGSGCVAVATNVV
jgi:hypothetical protein